MSSLRDTVEESILAAVLYLDPDMAAELRKSISDDAGGIDNGWTDGLYDAVDAATSVLQEAGVLE